MNSISTLNLSLKLWSSRFEFHKNRWSTDEYFTMKFSIEYWFRCMDLNGDGVLSLYELECFYNEQLHKMEELGMEKLSFKDAVCQVCLASMSKECDEVSRVFDSFSRLRFYNQKKLSPAETIQISRKSFFAILWGSLQDIFSKTLKINAM